MKRRQGLTVLAALGLAILMAGCWGSSKSTSLEVSGGASPIATAAAVGIDKCHNCHANTAVGGAGIFEAWALGRHGNNDGAHAVLPPADYFGEPPEDCSGCHDPNGDSLNLQGYSGWGSTPYPRNVLGCEACHGGGSLHFGVGPIGGPKLGEYARPATAGQSSQYNTCTSCHSESNSPHDPSKPFGTVDEIIYDTHYDNASRAVGSNIQGYVIRKTANTACVDCHNPHTASMTANDNVGSPNLQWKNSAHGDLAGEAWKHYQWTAPSRQSCQRCHTTTGLINYLTDPANYNPAKNNFVWLSSPATDNRSETLYCYGCHTNYYGGVRDPGAITASYTGVTPEPVFPDVNASNVCLACHTGRESGDSVKAPTGSFDNRSFINSHYLTAGATLFRESGYTYYDNDAFYYANLSTFEHDNVGTTAAAGTGSNGPCVGCHMSSWLNPADPTQGKHKFLPVGRDNTGAGEIITTAACSVCHNGVKQPVMDITALHAAEEEALAALAVLDNVLRSKGIFFGTTHPYFFTAPYDNAYVETGSCSNNLPVKNWNTGGTSSFTYNAASRSCDSAVAVPGTDNTGKNNMGAAFNYNVLAHDPGFFVHNNHYAKLLTYDAIDWLDNSGLDNSVQSYIDANITDAQIKADALQFFGASGRPPTD